VAAAAGVAQIAFTKAAAWGDYDNDGSPDLYVSNFGQENFLYHNNRDGTFTEMAKALGVEGPIASFPTWFFDYDNDGCQDLFVSSYVQSVTEIVKELLRRPVQVETTRLYRSTCRGGFEDVSEATGVNRVSMAMGANFGDIDNDGFLDFYLGTGSPSYGALVPNLLFRNEGGKRFADVTLLTGTGHLQKGHGVAFGDVDGDGDQDIFLHTGGAVPGDAYGNVLFRNPGRPITGYASSWWGARPIARRSVRGSKLSLSNRAHSRAPSNEWCRAGDRSADPALSSTSAWAGLSASKVWRSIGLQPARARCLMTSVGIRQSRSSEMQKTYRRRGQ
jgi:hypothetical protein